MVTGPQLILQAASPKPNPSFSLTLNLSVLVVTVTSGNKISCAILYFTIK